MEVGETILSLDFVNAELDLAEGMIFVVLEIRERDFEDAAFQRIVRILKTASAVDKSLSDAFRRRVSSFPTIIMKNVQLESNSLSGLEGRGSLLLVNKAQYPGNQVAYLHRVLVFPGEGINSSLLDALLALRQALVPSRSLATCSLGLRLMTLGSKCRTFQQP